MIIFNDDGQYLIIKIPIQVLVYSNKVVVDANITPSNPNGIKELFASFGHSVSNAIIISSLHGFVKIFQSKSINPAIQNKINNNIFHVAVIFINFDDNPISYKVITHKNKYKNWCQ